MFDWTTRFPTLITEFWSPVGSPCVITLTDHGAIEAKLLKMDRRSPSILHHADHA